MLKKIWIYRLMLEIKRGNNDNGNGYFVFILSNMGGEVLFRGGGRGKGI